MIRKWCAIAAVGAFLTLPVFGQTTQRSTDDGTNTANETTTKSTSDTSNAVSVAPASQGLFAVPAIPRATPFPGPADADKNSDKNYGRLFPRFELGLAFSYVDFVPGSPFYRFNSYGGTGSFTYNFTRWIGLTGEIGGAEFNRTLPTTPTNTTLHGSFATWVFGPRISVRKFDHVVPFVEFLIGGASDAPEVTGVNGEKKPVIEAGGGIDVPFSRNFAWRAVQIDYLMTNFNGPFLPPSDRQNNLKVSTGIVFRWGYPSAPPPPAPAGPPVASCSANPSSVYVGSNDTVAVQVTASSPANLPLTYSYTATGGAVDGSGPAARWSSSGVGSGSYTVNVKVTDAKGGAASCAADIRVEEKPHHPPTISCSANPSTIQPGERSTITATANSADNLNLTYNYSATGGQVTGNGPTAQFDSTGLQPGSYTVNCGVTDERGDKADASTNVDVQQPPPPPQATKIGDCDSHSYRTPGSSRVDNICKRVLDDVSLRLKNEPNAKLVIVGYADPKEPHAGKLAETRADLARKYLGEKGIDASRISVRAGVASKEKGAEKDNRRIEAIFVPEGATY